MISNHKIVNSRQIMFIFCRDVGGGFYGGIQFTKRNYDAINSYFSEQINYLNLRKHLYLGSDLKNKIIRKCMLIFGYHRIYPQDEKKILDLAIKYERIFISISHYGRLAKLIKKKSPQIQIITFFENVEYEFAKYAPEHKKYGFVNEFLIHHTIFRNEQWTCRYSDAIIALNQRDANLIKHYYKRDVDAIIPISLPDKYIKHQAMKISVIPLGLFLGSNFFANTNGILWFIKNVLPFVNIRLQIIGKNMDKVNFPQSDKLEVLGYVDYLEPYIQNADFMIFPIFEGGGMKVKTCEALMHGKNIIGTHEAFEGYDVDFEKVGACCETAEEFIEAINGFPKRFTRKFNEYSRNIFLEKYSNEVTFKQFADLFKKLEQTIIKENAEWK